MDKKRIVLNTKDNLLYTGLVIGKEAMKDEQGVLIELDPKSGLKLWCPENNIDSVIEVDLSKYQELESSGD
ncbi:hypothetical protein GF337_01225 [candidate division KSB1 bacterium]|nr:hypothetical protein [candidate division KSB1 bacterium]